jgi:hypothetical protein
VLPVQRKRCAVVVEQPSLPVEVIMAFQARSALGLKLPVVHLPVAFQAVLREFGELLDRGTRFTCIYMAGTAGLFPVCPFKQVARELMVEGDVVPA